MKIKILDKAGKEKGTTTLPSIFSEPVRLDIIQKTVIAQQANRRQLYGPDTEAGKKHSTWVSRRRRKYRGSYGHGISRVPRRVVSRRGTRFNWIGSLAPQAIGGRRAHPPKTEKNWTLKINKKERRKAIRSAISATMIKELVSKRGHNVPKLFPFILDNEVEKLEKTKDVKDMLTKLDLEKEMDRTQVRTIRAGRGKTRGRKYKTKTGPLIVVKENCKLTDAAKNIPGVEIIDVKNLNAEILAPGSHPGRLTLFTQAAIEKIEKEKMFI